MNWNLGRTFAFGQDLLRRLLARPTYVIPTLWNYFQFLPLIPQSVARASMLLIGVHLLCISVVEHLRLPHSCAKRAAADNANLVRAVMAAFRRLAVPT